MARPNPLVGGVLPKIMAITARVAAAQLMLGSTM